MHVYDKDIEDLPSLVTSRGNETHVHIGVDAQTGLGTRPPRPYSSNIGNATTGSHRDEKQRMLENLHHGKYADSHKDLPFRGGRCQQHLHLKLLWET